MSFWAKLLKRKGSEQPQTPLESSEETAISKPEVHYEEIPSTSDLGWYRQKAQRVPGDFVI